MPKRLFHIVIKPDGFYRNIVENIVENLISDYGINICVASIIKPNAQLLDIMYEDFKWEHDYIFHNRKLFELGPSLSLVCYANEKIDFEILKGGALPSDNYKNNSVRARFNIVDRSINLIHIADNEKKSFSEIKEIYQCNPIKYDGVSLSVGQVSEIVDTTSFHYNYLDIMRNMKKRIILLISNYLCLKCGILDSDGMFEINETFPTRFYRLYEVFNKIEFTIQNHSTDAKIRLLDYFIKCAIDANLYISSFENYALYSQAYYSSINKLV